MKIKQYFFIGSLCLISACSSQIQVEPESPTDASLTHAVTAGCTTLNSSTISASGNYCIDPARNYGSISVNADNVTLDGSAARGTRLITDYLNSDGSWRYQNVSSLNISGKKNITIAHLDMTGRVGINSAASDIVVEDSTMRGVRIEGKAVRIKFLRNIIHWADCNCGQVRQIYVSAGSNPNPMKSDYIFMFNKIIFEEHSNTDEPGLMWIYYTTHFLIGENYFYSSPSSRMTEMIRYRDSSSFGVFENNVLDNNSMNTGSGQSVFGFAIVSGNETSPDPRGHWVRNNFIHVKDYGIRTPVSGKENQFKYNVVYGEADAFLEMNGGAASSMTPATTGNLVFEHNTFVSKNGDPVSTKLSGPINVSSNLLANFGNQNLDSISSLSPIGSNNLFSGVSTPVIGSWDINPFRDANSLSLFVNKDAFDFHLQANSSFCSSSDPKFSDKFRGAFRCNNNSLSGPTKPLNLKAELLATDKKPYGVNLEWEASAGKVGIAKYKLFKAQGTGELRELNTGFGSILGPSMLDPDVANGITYRYAVKAVDGAGAESALSDPVSITIGGTAPPTTPDTTAPSVPNSLAATAMASTQVNLAWGSSTDTGGSGLQGYRIFRNGSEVGASTSPSYSDSGLTPATPYSYTVKALDNAGNSSASSSIASATTPAGAPPASDSCLSLLADDCRPPSIDQRPLVCNDSNGIKRVRLNRDVVGLPTAQIVWIDYSCYSSSGFSDDTLALWEFYAGKWKLIKKWGYNTADPLTGCDTAEDGADGTVATAYFPAGNGEHILRVIETADNSSAEAAFSSSCPNFHYGQIVDDSFEVIGSPAGTSALTDTPKMDAQTNEGDMSVSTGCGTVSSDANLLLSLAIVLFGIRIRKQKFACRRIK